MTLVVLKMAGATLSPNRVSDTQGKFMTHFIGCLPCPKVRCFPNHALCPRRDHQKTSGRHVSSFCQHSGHPAGRALRLRGPVHPGLVVLNGKVSRRLVVRVVPHLLLMRKR